MKKIEALIKFLYYSIFREDGLISFLFIIPENGQIDLTLEFILTTCDF